MVVFTCNHCGETLHKPKVEKHYQTKCRNYKSVTCVDCFKDFRDEEYVPHTKCITEEERYSAKGTYKDPLVKKGEAKQESWLEMIQSICETEQSLKPSLKNLLQTISGYSNVPRKRVKFVNFIKSSSGNRVNMYDVEQVWDIIEKYKLKQAANRDTGSTKNSNSNQSTSEDKNESVVQQNGVKRKHKGDSDGGTQEKKTKINTISTPEEACEATAGNSTKFSFKEKVLDILSQKQTISHKKLQKKILKAYKSEFGEIECEEKVIKKFNKKLQKLPNVIVENDKVSLTV